MHFCLPVCRMMIGSSYASSGQPPVANVLPAGFPSSKQGRASTLEMAGKLTAYSTERLKNVE